MGIVALGYKIHYTVGEPVTAASELPITLTGDYFVVSGTTTIGSLKSMGKGMQVLLEFSDAVTLTYSSSLVLPDAEDYIAEAGDVLRFVETSLGVWECISTGSGGGVLKNIIMDGRDNTAVGIDSMTTGITTALSNTCLGSEAGKAMVTSDGNVAIGKSAMTAANACGSNTAVGTNALSSLTSGDNNTAIGRSALSDIETSNDSVSVGFLSCESMTTGSNLAVMGSKAIQNVTEANNSVVIGYNAGSVDTTVYDVTEVTNCVYVGASITASSTTPENEMVLGYGAVGKGTYTISIGSPLTTATYLTGTVNLTDTGQIQFPATQNTSTNANTMDDYEEGTFTPTMSFSTTSDVTYSKQYGKYVKVGNCVSYVIDLKLSALGTSSGTLQIDGLPFTTGSDIYSNAAVFTEQFYFSTGCPSVYINPGNTYCRPGYLNSTGGITRFTDAHMENASAIRLNGHYFV